MSDISKIELDDIKEFVRINGVFKGNKLKHILIITNWLFNFIKSNTHTSIWNQLLKVLQLYL